MRMEHAWWVQWDETVWVCDLFPPWKDAWEGWNPQHKGSLLARNWPYRHQYFGLSVSATVKQCYPDSPVFVFWATKYAFLDFLLEVTVAHLEFSLHLSTSDSIGFWKVRLGYGTNGLLNVCFQSSLYIKSLPEVLHMSDPPFLPRSRTLGLLIHSLSES